MARPPIVAALTTDRGAPGTTIRTTAIGAGLDAVTAMRVSGRGVAARVLGRPVQGVRGGALDLMIVIAADAAPGPRVVQAVLGGVGAGDGVLFHVRAGGSAGGAFGIGAQLI